MAKTGKEILYWLTVAFYGILLAFVLLYFRFPAEKFRLYSQTSIEKLFPQVSCSISKIRFSLPTTIVFEGMQITKKGEENELFYVDGRLAVRPSWQSFGPDFAVTSRAFGGQHSGRLVINPEQNRVDLQDLQISQVDMTQIQAVGRLFQRRVTGNLGMNGSLSLAIDRPRLMAGEGTVSVTNGEFDLKKPILEQDVIGLEDVSANYLIDNEAIEFIGGVVNNKKLKATFAGDVKLVAQAATGAVSLEGEIEPLAPIYEEKRQLRAIVTRMQKRFKGTALPYSIGGTIGRPTFAFQN